MRMLATFRKDERIRHIGHLDILRAMQRALRRSGIPADYSKGFNPHMLLTFASALSVGAVGQREIMEVSLAGEIEPEEFMTRLNAALPPEMQLTSARLIEDTHPATMSMVCAARYHIALPDGDRRLIEEKLSAYLEQTEIITNRKTKSGIKPCDIRPLIYDLRAEDDGLFAELALTERESCKPAMLLTTLYAFAGLEPGRCRIIRTALLGTDASGRRVPLEDL